MPKRSAENKEEYLKRKMQKYKDKLDKIVNTENNNTADEPQIVADIETEDNGQDNEIPEEYILALGKEGDEQVIKGEEIRPELATRWTRLMCSGLGKESLENIIKKYPTPSNFDESDAPKMNPEMLASLSEVSIKRDKRIIHRQNIMAKIMCALGKTLTSVMKGDINSKLIIEQVNDAAKMCAEIYFQDSSSRKFFALAGANQVIKDAVRDSKPDTFLFGTSCAEKIKAAQAIKKTGSQIKVSDPTPQPNTANTKSAKQQPTTKKQGNWRGPPQQYHQRARGGHRPPPVRKYHQQPRDLKRTQRSRQTHRR